MVFPWRQPRQPSKPAKVHVVPTPDLLFPGEDLLQAVRQRVAAVVAGGSFAPPRLPVVAREVLRISADPRSSAEQVAQVVQRDQFIAGELLRLANSAQSGGLGGALTGIKPAIVRAGLGQVRNIVMVAALQQRVFRGPRKALMVSLWQQSLGTAVACQLLAAATGKNREQAFMLGLLHDVGKPILVGLVERIARKKSADRVEVDVALPVLLEELGASVGSMVLRRWQLPPELIELYEEVDEGRAAHSGSAMVGMLDAATWLAQCLPVGVAGEPPERASGVDLDVAAWLVHPGVAAMGLTTERATRVFQQFPSQRDALLGNSNP